MANGMEAEESVVVAGLEFDVVEQFVHEVSFILPSSPDLPAKLVVQFKDG